MFVQENAAVPVAAPEHPHSADEDPRWLLVERILATPDFIRSPRLSEFLRYASKESLEGRGDDLNEQRIGEVVFGRRPGYDSSADSIVRSHALRLRQRLDEFFLHTGRDETLRLTIPRGSYIVVFETVPSVTTQSSTSSPVEISTSSPSNGGDHFDESTLLFGDEQGHQDPKATVPSIGLPHENAQEKTVLAKRPSVLVATCILLGACSLVLATILFFVLHAQRTAGTPHPPLHPLWNVMFGPRQPTTFVAADSALALLHGEMRKETTLDDYLAHNFQEQLGNISPSRASEIIAIGQHRYTSYVDLEALHRFESLPQTRQSNFTVKYARDLRISDLKNGNIIISGSSDANPWVDLFEPDMNFIMHRDFEFSRSVVINKHPLAGEETNYVISSSDSGPKDKVYGVIAFLPNLDGVGHALILEGSSLAGTEAVSDFLFDDAAFLPFLARIQHPNGSLPHFEVLLESDTHGGNAGRFHVLTYRTYR